MLTKSPTDAKPQDVGRYFKKMKINKILIFLIIIQSGIIFSQNTKIDKKQIIPLDIEFKGNVKKITLKTFDLNKKVNKIDTTKTISEIFFSKLKKIFKINKYDKSLENLWSVTEFDELERVKTISRKNEDKMFNFVIQYFSNETEFPDSTSIFYTETYKEKYINYFKNKLVTKQYHYVNDSLQDYRSYKYNNKKQLIEDIYLNPENDSDETVVSKSNYQLSIYPEKLTKYEYKESKDTLITIKIRPKYNLREVTKKLKTKLFSVEIKEEFDKDYLKNSKFIYTYKDSINESSYYYKNKKEIKNYYKTISTQKSIISKWKTEGYGDDSERNDIIKIDVIYDKFKNWIRKSYSKENQITRIIEREIEYY